MGQTVNLLVFTFGGSNPSLPTEMPTESSEFFESSNWGHFFAEVAQLIEH